MAQQLKAIHPKFIKNGMKLFNIHGEEVEVFGYIELSGVYHYSIVDEQGTYLEIKFDSHDYSGYGCEERPRLFRKSPIKGGK